MNEFVEYLNWCRRLYDSNCIERGQHGMDPYPSFENYYETNKDWLRREYNKNDRQEF
tara:strand:+ start:275 stop:445 length:171 start_codon:yes stop_codon:yes gene_type:complete